MELTTGERRRLEKVERILRRGRLRFAFACATFGAVGGVLFALAMRLVAPCFGCRPLSVGTNPSPIEASFVQAAQTFGLLPVVIVACAVVFGIVFGFAGLTRLWSMQVQTHRVLSTKARSE